MECSNAVQSSPHDRTLAEHCPELGSIAQLLSTFAFLQRSLLSPVPCTASDISRKYANGARSSHDVRVGIEVAVLA